MHAAIAATSNVFLAGEHIVSSVRIGPETPVSRVFDLFTRTPEADAFALVVSHKPVGLITRTKFFFTLSRRYGYELYAKLPISAIADSGALTVSEDEMLEEVVAKAVQRPQQDIYDEILVTRCDGTYLGLMSVKQLVIKQGDALARSVLQRELATERARELERINRVKSQFLAHVTHELRSPVNAIVGLAELLRTAAENGSIEHVQERLSFMMSSAITLRTIITNILDLSKMEAGKMEVTHQMIDVVPMLSEIAETTRILVGVKPVEVRLTVPGGPVTVETDPIKLRQIVTNLTGNAAKFTDAGFIHITLRSSGEAIDLEIGDSGIGIKDEDLELIFTTFGQVEDATTKSHEGTGLGLAITRNLVRLMGASISVTSNYGRGTTFTVTLPRQNQRKGAVCNAEQEEGTDNR